MRRGIQIGLLDLNHNDQADTSGFIRLDYFNRAYTDAVRAAQRPRSSIPDPVRARGAAEMRGGAGAVSGRSARAQRGSRTQTRPGGG